MQKKFGLLIASALLGLGLSIAGPSICRAQGDLTGAASGAGGIGNLGGAISGSLSRAGNATAASPSACRMSGHATGRRHHAAARHPVVHHRSVAHRAHAKKRH
jgi:hypothetical protein